MNRRILLGIGSLVWIPVLVIACLATASFAQAPAAGSASGSIAGKLTDDKGAPLGFANVIVQGTALGAITKADGTFQIDKVPAGTYDVVIRFVGFKPATKSGIVVAAGKTTRLDASIKEEPIKIKEVEVVTEKPVVNVQSSTSERTFSSQEAKVRVVNTVEDALAKQAGVVQMGGQLFVRGGRSDEVKYYVDGLPVTDPLQGASHIDVSLSSLDDVSLLSGGFDAEYGNAQSGVVELTTKEGSQKFTGLVKFMTDDFGAPDKSYFNTDDLSLGLGGPTPMKNLSYYFSGEGTATNTYLHTQEVRPIRKWLGLTFRERQRNLFSGDGKMTLKVGGKSKLIGETLFSEEDFDQYEHDYSRVGFWSPTSGPGGTGEWWFEPLDSTFTYYNGPEHTPNYVNQHRQTHLRFTRTINDATFYTAALAVHNFYNESIVKDLSPSSYDYTTGSNNDRDPLNLFYVIRGDAPNWHKQWSNTYTAKADLTHESNNGPNVSHRMKTGFITEVYDLRYDLRDYPSELQPLGLFPDQYHIRSWGTSAYAQDRFKYEGMVLNAGLRFDAFDPSKASFDRANERRKLLGLSPVGDKLMDRLIWQVSPRLGMAYPISDRDVLRFHYGRFQDVPRLENLYRYTGPDATINPNTIIGNPFLQAKTTISYEVGVEHQFWGMSSINVTFFYRDVFGLIGTQQEQAASYDPRNPPGITYVNLDYGTSQGVEFSLRKYNTPGGRWSGGVTYTYSRAVGSSSSENQGFNVLTGGQDRSPIKEVTLDWDRPHVLSANLYFQEQGVWGLNLEGEYTSGSPFTPIGLYDKTTPVDSINVRRLPSVFQISLKGDKRYKIYGQEFSLFLEGNNLTDRKNVFLLDPQGNRYYTVFYTQYGQFGGAYNLRDVRKDLTQDVLLPLDDPRVYEEPRNFKAGIQFDW